VIDKSKNLLHIDKDQFVKIDCKSSAH